MINNELRRTKVKLALFEQEGIDWLLNDLLERATGIDEGMRKREIISNLKEQYQRYIKENSKKNGKQGNLFN